MDGLGSMGGAIVLLVLLVAVFLICREIVCWYWKVNEAVKILGEIRDLLARMAGPAPPASEKPTDELMAM